MKERMNPVLIRVLFSSFVVGSSDPKGFFALHDKALRSKTFRVSLGSWRGGGERLP